MSKLPVVSGQEVREVLEKIGFEFKRQRKHMILFKPGAGIVTIPKHRELDRGTLRGIIEDAGLTVEEFKRLL